MLKLIAKVVAVIAVLGIGIGVGVTINHVNNSEHTEKRHHQATQQVSQTLVALLALPVHPKKLPAAMPLLVALLVSHQSALT